MNPNLFVWTTDWHVVSNDLESGGIGETRPTNAAEVSAHIAALEPAGAIDTGDCRDHLGVGNADEFDRYIDSVRDLLPWATVNGGVNALFPILPGNHDELHDNTIPGSPTDFTEFDSKFWGPPYHWTCDWEAPRIRFIALHCEIIHAPDILVSFFSLDASEVEWLEDELAALPADWQAIVCSHAPANSVFGNEIRHDAGGTALIATLAANRTKIAAYLCGHRHQNMSTNVKDGILHLSGPGMAYTQGNGLGGWSPITYDPQARTLTFDFLLGPPSAFTRFAGFTPIEVQLPTAGGGGGMFAADYLGSAGFGMGRSAIPALPPVSIRSGRTISGTVATRRHPDRTRTELVT